MQLVMLCPTLMDLGGHEYDYTKEVASAALHSGNNVDTILPVTADNLARLPGKHERLLPPYGYPASRFGRLLTALRRFLCYYRAIQRYKGQDTLFFIHSVPQNELMVIICAWLFAKRAGQDLALFVRQTIASSHAKKILVRLMTLSTKYHTHYVSDSDTLVEDLAKRLRSRVTLMPIPVAFPEQITRETTKIVCGYFGARRRVKGFTLLPQMVEAGHQTSPSTQFTIQAYAHRDEKPDADIEGILGALRQRKNVRLIEDALDTDSFAREIFSCHIVLIPYEATNYKDATSGIFVMAVVARSVVIVTENTWMARQAEKLGLCRVVIMPDRPNDKEIADAVQSAFTKAQQNDAQSDQERQWCNTQNPGNLWRTLRSLH